MNEISLRNRNYWLILMEGVCFLIAFSFLDANAIIPVFIYTYTSSLELAGLATTLSTACSVVAQTLVGPFVNRIRCLPAYIVRIMFIFRPLPLLMIPILFSGMPSLTVVILFLVIYGLLWGSDGLIVVPWGDLFARTIAPEKRGKLLGVQQLLGGIGCLATGFVIKFLLENKSLTDPLRFSILFGCAAVLLLVGTTLYTFVRDLPRKVSEEKSHPLHYYSRLPAYFFRNKAFIRLAFVRIFASFATMISPFLILFGRELFSLNASQVSTLIYIQIVGSLLGGIVWGTLSSRIGNKAVILAAQGVSLLLPVLAMGCLLLKGLTLPYFILWFIVLANGMLKGSWLGYMNYTIDISSEEDRTVYLLLDNLITFPLTFLSFAAGAVADRWGFVPLFIISAAGAAVAVLLSLRLKAIPRSTEE